MKTLTGTTLNKKQVTLTLRPTSELGAEPNVFVSAEVFAQYEADAGNYTRERAIAEYQELKDLAIIAGQLGVAQKLITDITRMEMVKRTTAAQEAPPLTNEDINSVPPESDFDRTVRETNYHTLKDFYQENKKDDLTQLNSDTALHDLLATEEANKRKSVASIVGERMKLLQKKHDSKEFTRDVAYASFEELRRVSMSHGGLNTARLLIRDKCEVCDIPSLHQRKFTKSPKEQRQEAEEAARLEEERIAEEEAAREAERAKERERLAAKRRRLAQQKQAAENWKEIKYFVMHYPRAAKVGDSLREQLMKQTLRAADTYAEQQKRLGAESEFPITVASIERVYRLLFFRTFYLEGNSGKEIEDDKDENGVQNFEPYLSLEESRKHKALEKKKALKQSALRHLEYRIEKLTNKYLAEEENLLENELAKIELSTIKLREKLTYLLYGDNPEIYTKLDLPYHLNWSLERIDWVRENLLKKIRKDGWGQSFREQGKNEINLLVLDRGIFRSKYEDEEVRAERKKQNLTIFVGFTKQPFAASPNDPSEIALSDCFSEYRNTAPPKKDQEIPRSRSGRDPP